MTVSELIEKLKAFPQNARVVTPGFDESNYDDISDPYEITLAINANSGNHCGEHEEIRNSMPVGKSKIEQCVAIDF